MCKDTGTFSRTCLAQSRSPHRTCVLGFVADTAVIVGSAAIALYPGCMWYKRIVRYHRTSLSVGSAAFVGYRTTFCNPAGTGTLSGQILHGVVPVRSHHPGTRDEGVNRPWVRNDLIVVEDVPVGSGINHRSL